MGSGPDIMGLIRAAQERFGTASLYAGNCGMFAQGLGLFLREQGVEATLAFIFRDGDDAQTIADVIQAETDIYHVVLEAQGRMYDGDGPCTADDLLALAEQEYGDQNPGYFHDVVLDDPAMGRLIRTETNWSIDAETFLAFFKGLRTASRESNGMKNPADELRRIAADMRVMDRTQ